MLTSRLRCSWLPRAFFCPAGALGQDDGSISQEMRAADLRLASRTTIVESRITIGELLSKLAVASQVPLSADDSDGSGDVELAAYARNTSLADAMNCVWSLVSYAGARWRWVRSGAAGSYSYMLTRPLGARGLPGRLVKDVQAALDREVDAMIGLAMMDPGERRAHIGGVVRETLDGDGRLAADFLKEKRHWAGLRTFAENTSLDERTAVLHLGPAAVRDVDTLTPAGREFVRSVWEESHGSIIHADASREATPMPRSIRFFADRVPSKDVIPVFLISLDGLGGYAYAGGLPAQGAQRKRLVRMWLQDGELQHSRPEKGRFGPKPLVPDEDLALQPTDRMLKQLSDCASFDVYVRLPRLGTTTIGSQPEPFGKEKDDWFGGLWYLFDWKWRGNSMLAATPGWFYEVDNLIPWRIRSEMRKTRNEEFGTIPLSSLCLVASKITAAQMFSLFREYPVMRDAAAFHDALATMQDRPLLRGKLLSPQGAPLDEAYAVVEAVPGWSRADAIATGAQAVRVEYHGGYFARTDFVLLARGGSVIASRGFTDPGFTPAERAAIQQKAKAP